MPPSLLMQATQDVWRILDASGYPKAIAGGLALSFWGYPRSTRDIDIAIVVKSKHDFFPLLSRAGLQPKKKSKDTTKLGFLEVSQWVYSIAESYVDIDLDLLISDSPYFLNAIERAVSCSFAEISIDLKVLSCEDIIIFKAISGRIIDQADIQMLMSVNASTLDYDYLSRKSEELEIRLYSTR